MLVLVIGVSVRFVVEASKLHLDHTPRWPPRITPSTALKLHHVLGRYRCGRMLAWSSAPSGRMKSRWNAFRQELCNMSNHACATEIFGADRGALSGADIASGFLMRTSMPRSALCSKVWTGSATCSTALRYTPILPISRPLRRTNSAPFSATTSSRVMADLCRRGRKLVNTAEGRQAWTIEPDARPGRDMGVPFVEDAVHR